MVSLPENVRQAWEDREGPVILATVDDAGVPNIIYATCVSTFGDDRLVIADNYFDKTRKNILKGGKNGSILFMTKDGEAYQIKGTLEYHTEDEIYDHMKTWNPAKHPGHAAAALLIEKVFSGAKQLC